MSGIVFCDVVIMFRMTGNWFAVIILRKRHWWRTKRDKGRDKNRWVRKRIRYNITREKI